MTPCLPSATRRARCFLSQMITPVTESMATTAPMTDIKIRPGRSQGLRRGDQRPAEGRSSLTPGPQDAQQMRRPREDKSDGHRG